MRSVETAVHTVMVFLQRKNSTRKAGQPREGGEDQLSRSRPQVPQKLVCNYMLNAFLLSRAQTHQKHAVDAEHACGHVRKRTDLQEEPAF